MARDEAATRRELIDPALELRGWTPKLIRKEVTPGRIEIVDGTPRQASTGRADYLLRVPGRNGNGEPVAAAVLEAKSEDKFPGHGLQQGKSYVPEDAAKAARRHYVRWVFSSNGHQFVEYDVATGRTSEPHPLSEFPTPQELRQRLEEALDLSLPDDLAPLLHPYPGGEDARRYYQDAAIRATMEKIARDRRDGKPPRALLTLATGSGKTLIAAWLLKRFADAGELHNALFVCDRRELRKQAAARLSEMFGAEVAVVTGADAEKNARVLVATYQTLGREGAVAGGAEATGALPLEEAAAVDVSFLVRNYPRNHFSHIIIDECHRSAWGKWSEVLEHNPDAVQIGLTATPRRLEYNGDEPEAEGDRQVMADNFRYFGDPVYEYTIAQGREDGYLAALELIPAQAFIEGHDEPEAETGVSREDLEGRQVADAVTGEVVTVEEAAEHYSAGSLERQLHAPRRVKAFCEHFFERLLATGGPHQKTIIFCASAEHARKVAGALGNLYADWCGDNEPEPCGNYAFECTAEAKGHQYITDLKGASRSHFIAVTVDLLSTGVDVHPVQNIVFFRYLNSPILFHQMIGRGTRLHAPTAKLRFRVYDYTNVRRLFNDEFITRVVEVPEPDDEPHERRRRRVLSVGDLEVRIEDGGESWIVTNEGNRAALVPLSEYRERLRAELLTAAPTLDELRARWVDPAERKALLEALPDGGHSAELFQEIEELAACDLFDVLAALGWEEEPLTRDQRAQRFKRRAKAWLQPLPPPTQATLKALVDQFAAAGTDAFESRFVWHAKAVKDAGGLAALERGGDAAALLRETKTRVFA